MEVGFADQREYDIRLEYGVQGPRALGSASLSVVVIVDVLSFSTCVSVAAERGALVYPYFWRDDSLQAYAEQHQAVVAGRRGDPTTKYSLSPQSIAHASWGERIVLPSPNGSSIAFDASEYGSVVAGSLRNRAAICRLVASKGYPVAVIAAGEQWPDGSLRPAIEDLLGAGAIVSQLEGSRSPEAQCAAAAFESVCPSLLTALRSSTSGKELIHRGFDEDITMASELDAADVAPVLNDRCFIAV
jgi:2-phosphosulfolactate phosphatase